MSAILQFIRDNHILALIEQTVVKKRSKLSLNAYEITEIPDLLYTCLEIEHLYLHRNKITTIPVQITSLTNLTTLTLDYNNISSLPAEIGTLKNLVNLNISYNPLKVLTPEIGDLENLEAFWCNKIGLREIPKEIGKLTKLDTLGARGNELRSLPEEMGELTKLRWLTLEHNQIVTLPSSLQNMQALVHCNLRDNQLTEFPAMFLLCPDLMFLQLNNNQIQRLPDDFDTSFLSVLEMIDIRENPVCESVTKPLPTPFRIQFQKVMTRILFDFEQYQDHPLVRYGEDLPTTEGPIPEWSRTPALAVNATQIRIAPAAPPRRPPPVLDIEIDTSSVSSEDWENSVTSSELDVQYQSDEERAENDAVGMVLPELSRYASTAS